MPALAKPSALALMLALSVAGCSIKSGGEQETKGTAGSGASTATGDSNTDEGCEVTTTFDSDGSTVSGVPCGDGDGDTDEGCEVTVTSDGSTTTGGPCGDGDGDGDGDGACMALNEGDYGACAAVLGVAFNGSQCVGMSGCDCAPDCEYIYDNNVECATSCAGQCRTAIIDFAGIAGDEWTPNSDCDQLTLCVAPGGLADVEAILGGPCVPATEFSCDDPSDTACSLGGGFPVGQATYEQTCAATLLPLVTQVECIVYGG